MGYRTAGYMNELEGSENMVVLAPGVVLAATSMGQSDGTMATGLGGGCTTTGAGVGAAETAENKKTCTEVWAY
jgi:hypothetical protein